MTIEKLKESTSNSEPPVGVSDEVSALWYDLKGDWDRAHAIAQGIATPRGSAIHAYLHRKEGDLGNAGYWYSRAGRSRHEGPLEQEWTELVEEMLK